MTTNAPDTNNLPESDLPSPAKPLRGFAALSPERRRELAALGGKSVPPEKRSFSQNKERFYGVS